MKIEDDKISAEHVDSEHDACIECTKQETGRSFRNIDSTPNLIELYLPAIYTKSENSQAAAPIEPPTPQEHLCRCSAPANLPISANCRFWALPRPGFQEPALLNAGNAVASSGLPTC